MKRSPAGWIVPSLGILLAGVSPFVADQTWLMWSLVIIGGLGVVGQLVGERIVDPMLTRAALKGLRASFDKDASIDYATNTYKCAREHGGTLLATHLLKDVRLKDDFPHKHLANGAQKPLHFERLFLFTNKLVERKWLEHFFQLGGESGGNITRVARFWHEVDLTPPLSLLNAIPKFNLLLYESADRSIYRSLLGFEAIKYAGRSTTERRVSLVSYEHLP
jgi:hypothetical protein